MIDDKLTLPKLTEAPSPEAGAVTLFALDDGEGVTRFYARSDDGSQFELTPPPFAPPALPAVALTTAASHGPTSYVALVTDAPVATHLGVAHRDFAVGEVIECAWPQLGGVVGWMDAAILAAPGTTGNPALGTVAAADVTASAGATGDVAALVPVTAPIPRGTSLWLTLAAWQPPGSVAPMPRVLASVFASRHAAVNGIPGWRPTLAGPGSFGWSVYGLPGGLGARPIAATVLLP